MLPAATNGMSRSYPMCQHTYKLVSRKIYVPGITLTIHFYQKMIIVIDMLYGPIAFCAKLSLFLLYYRLFARHQWIRYLVYLGVASAAAMYTASTIVYGYLCLPRRGQGWVEAGLSSRCHRQFILASYVRGPFNVVSDLYLLFLPLPAVWQLQIPLRKRLGIATIFLTGFL